MWGGVVNECPAQEQNMPNTSAEHVENVEQAVRPIPNITYWTPPRTIFYSDFSSPTGRKQEMHDIISENELEEHTAWLDEDELLNNLANNLLVHNHRLNNCEGVNTLDFNVG